MLSVFGLSEDPSAAPAIQRVQTNSNGNNNNLCRIMMAGVRSGKNKSVFWVKMWKDYDSDFLSFLNYTPKND